MFQTQIVSYFKHKQIIISFYNKSEKACKLNKNWRICLYQSFIINFPWIPFLCKSMTPGVPGRPPLSLPNQRLFRINWL